MRARLAAVDEGASDELGPDGRTVRRAAGPTAPYPCTARPNSLIQATSASGSGPASTAARSSFHSAALRGPQSTTSTCGDASTQR